jgi:PAP2 superfamily
MTYCFPQTMPLSSSQLNRGIFGEPAARLAALVVLGYLVATLLLLPSADAPFFLVTIGNPLARIVGLMGVVPFALGIVVHRFRAGGPAASGWTRGIQLAQGEGWFTERLAGYAMLWLLLPPFFWCFALWKAAIPPFTADVALAHWDRAVHGGDPFALLASLEHPWITVGLDSAYYLWRYLLIGLVLWQGWAGTPRDRARFWLAFILTWILLGTVLAHLLPSAGPGFYDIVTGSWGPFAPLMTYLTQVRETHHLAFFGVQSELQELARKGEVVLGGGISAFPSLHVAMPVLGACAAWKVSRWLAFAFLTFAAVIFLGSILLGWHYALDGEVSAIGVAAIWYATGFVTRRPPPLIRSAR